MLPFQVDPNWYEHYWYSPAKQQTVRREQRARKLLTSFLQAGYVMLARRTRIAPDNSQARGHRASDRRLAKL